MSATAIDSNSNRNSSSNSSGSHSSSDESTRSLLATVHIMRHAERYGVRQRSDEWARTVDRCHDDPLTPLGKEQAKEAAIQLLKEGYHIRRLLTSPFKRCIETALAMAEVLQVPVYVENALCELMKHRWFSWEGKTVDTVYLIQQQLWDTYGSEKVQFLDQSAFAECAPLVAWEEGEGEEVKQEDIPRLRRLAEILLQRPQDFDGAVVITHGGVAWQMVSHLLCMGGDEGVSCEGRAEYAARTTLLFACVNNDRAVATQASALVHTLSDSSSAAPNSAVSEAIHVRQVKPFIGPLRFTPSQDWNSAHFPNWRRIFSELAEDADSLFHPAHKQQQEGIRILEAGSWEGLSACRLKELFPHSQLHMVDHFDVANEDAAARERGRMRHERVIWNLKLTGHADSVHIWPMFTYEALTQHLLPQRMTFHVIYVDADHTSVGTLNDLVASWQLLSEGGVMIIDDYLWPSSSMAQCANIADPHTMDHPLHPKRAIDAFLCVYREELKVLHSGYQVIVQKVVKQHFLFPPAATTNACRLDQPIATSSGSAHSTNAATKSSSQSVGSNFAVLLPLTSKGQTAEQLVASLRAIADCLPADECVVMVGIDEDDPLLCERATAEALLARAFAGFTRDRVRVRYYPPTKPAAICAIASDLAMAAFSLTDDLHCDYFVLLGDDVRITPQRKWTSEVRSAFTHIRESAQRRFDSKQVSVRIPAGFGVVALNDETFPGFPTFPIVGRAHLQCFGHLFPSVFVNQDGDPFLWALYRPFGARRFAHSGKLHNAIGGDEHTQARYERQHCDWKFDVLSRAQQKMKAWLEQQAHSHSHSLADSATTSSASSSATAAVSLPLLTTIDVVVPTFRTVRSLLRGIISLTAPVDCDVGFILIVDNPTDTAVRSEFERDFGERVLVRVNSVNRGASASRNRGIEESTADWVLFLDDDVVPDPFILHVYYDAICERGDRACGFAGLSRLPPPSTYLTAGLTMSYLTFFWRVAELREGDEQVPWAVTANVMSRRLKHARFDEAFLRTGGGEDIDYLRHAMRETGLPLLKAPAASVTHPWWNDSYPEPRRFYRWAYSDVLLLQKQRYPECGFYSAPNLLEFALLWTIGCILLLLCESDGVSASLIVCLVGIAAMNIADAAMDVYHLMYIDTTVAGEVRGWRRIYCALISWVYKNACETGHLVSPLSRGELSLFCKRMDWWFGLHPAYIRERRERECKRAAVFAACAAVSVAAPAVAVVVLTVAAIIGAVCYTAFAYPIRTRISASNEAGSAERRTSPLSVAADAATAAASATAAVGTMTVVFIADENYVAPLCAALYSLLQHHNTLQPLHLIVVDVGITDASWSKLLLLINEFDVRAAGSVRMALTRQKVDVTQLLTDAGIDGSQLPHSQFGTWCKLWLDVILPADAQRIIYLDSDILVRSSLVPLWQQLCAADPSVPLLAVRDIGFPCGPKELQKFGWPAHPQQYFNAGVLLLNLSVIRSQHTPFGRALRSAARRFVSDASIRFADQDILNLVFANRWKSLSLRYNLQGLGSYAEGRIHSSSESSLQQPFLYTADEFAALQRDAVIIHFTGSSAPSFAEAIHPHYTIACKPWSWVCYHPWRCRYLDSARRTPFRDHFPSTVNDSGADVSHSPVLLPAHRLITSLATSIRRDLQTATARLPFISAATMKQAMIQAINEQRS